MRGLSEGGGKARITRQRGHAPGELDGGGSLCGGLSSDLKIMRAGGVFIPRHDIASTFLLMLVALANDQSLLYIDIVLKPKNAITEHRRGDCSRSNAVICKFYPLSCRTRHALIGRDLD